MILYRAGIRFDHDNSTSNDERIRPEGASAWQKKFLP